MALDILAQIFCVVSRLMQQVGQLRSGKGAAWRSCGTMTQCQFFIRNSVSSRSDQDHPKNQARWHGSESLGALQVILALKHVDNRIKARFAQTSHFVRLMISPTRLCSLQGGNKLESRPIPSWWGLSRQRDVGELEDHRTRTMQATRHCPSSHLDLECSQLDPVVRHSSNSAWPGIQYALRMSGK